MGGAVLSKGELNMLMRQIITEHVCFSHSNERKPHGFYSFSETPYSPGAQYTYRGEMQVDLNLYNIYQLDFLKIIIYGSNKTNVVYVNYVKYVFLFN